ncbi:HB2L protein, partial [Sterrhoptilus dennistouni]|nr:HB2L protein [Sterrhoptilus dennistouni]
GTEKVRFVERLIYNREQYLMFDSDVGHFVGYTARGEKCAQHFNSNPDYVERKRAAVDWFCRGWYKTVTPFGVER